ncbi:hypothetical protein GCM10010412_022410 [Nonomuraea recticatena]|uniref:Uncharacterized protein n=1 Tax=Nonomuraea recticatena TaxID=46178 RepID=A0ABN3RJ34_9ACTN
MAVDEPGKEGDVAEVEVGGAVHGDGGDLSIGDVDDPLAEQLPAVEQASCAYGWHGLTVAAAQAGVMSSPYSPLAPGWGRRGDASLAAWPMNLT